MTSTNRLRLVNSAVAFATALIVMITVHEFAHAACGLRFGLQPRVFPGRVTYGVTGTTGQQVGCLLAGPVASLVIGLLVLLAAPAPRGFWGLLAFWFGTLNVQEFTGYLTTGPFVAVGDIGAAMHLLAAPAWTYAVAVAAGLAGTGLLGRFATRRLLALTEPAVTGATRAGQLRSLGLYAWLLGAALVVVSGGLAADLGDRFTLGAFVELLGTLTSGIFLVLVRVFMGREDVPGRGPSLTWPIAGIVLLVGVAVARRLVLGPGLRLGD